MLKQNLQLFHNNSAKISLHSGAFVTAHEKVKLFVKLLFIINMQKSTAIYLMFKCHSLLIVRKSNSVEGVFIPTNGKIELLKWHSLLTV